MGWVDGQADDNAKTRELVRAIVAFWTKEVGEK